MALKLATKLRCLAEINSCINCLICIKVKHSVETKSNTYKLYLIMTEKRDKHETGHLFLKKILQECIFLFYNNNVEMVIVM